jgi:hypothetical protein
VSELDVPLLVRRTRLLLRAYPPAYRAHRGEEILDTLLETTRPGHGWPPAREIMSVIGGGLRARRAANLSQGLRASLRHVMMLIAALWLIAVPQAMVSDAIDAAPYSGTRSFFESLPLIDAPMSVMALLIIAAAWSGRRWLAVAIAVAAAVFAVYWLNEGPVQTAGSPMVAVVSYVAPATLLLALLTRRANRPSRSLLWLLLCPLLATAAEQMLSTSGHQQYLLGRAGQAAALMYPYDTVPSLITVAVAACWLITDIRPLAAIAISFTVVRLVIGFFGVFLFGPSVGNTSTVQVAVSIAAPLAICAALAWLQYHRSRTAPPTIG